MPLPRYQQQINGILLISKEVETSEKGSGTTHSTPSRGDATETWSLLKLHQLEIPSGNILHIFIFSTFIFIHILFHSKSSSSPRPIQCTESNHIILVSCVSMIVVTLKIKWNNNLTFINLDNLDNHKLVISLKYLNHFFKESVETFANLSEAIPFIQTGEFCRGVARGGGGLWSFVIFHENSDKHDSCDKISCVCEVWPFRRI